MFYFVLPNFLNKIGYISDAIKARGNGVDYMTAIVGPQSIGQVIGAFLIVIFVLKESEIMFKLSTWKNILTGLVWATGIFSCSFLLQILILVKQLQRRFLN